MYKTTIFAQISVFQCVHMHPSYICYEMAGDWLQPPSLPLNPPLSTQGCCYK